jgi:4-hydroxymandelate oxidase
MTRLERQERTAADALDPSAFDYFAGGSGDEATLAANRSAWHDIELRPRVLTDVAHVSTTTSLLGTALGTPILAAPTALHGLAHPEGEVATARGVAAAGSLLVLSTRASMPLESVAAALDGAPWWFQVYVMRDRGLTRALVERAAAAGATALVLTGDTPYVGTKRRSSTAPSIGAMHLANLAGQTDGAAFDERMIEQDPSITADIIGELGDWSALPVVVKGVLRGDDAERCLQHGAAGVVVSNHGGRQLDRAIATARALPEVVAAVDGRAPVLVDGGLRSGIDVLAALALGAQAVLVGRPVLWALASDGADGVRACIDSLGDELREAMALAGATAVTNLPDGLVTMRP